MQPFGDTMMAGDIEALLSRIAEVAQSGTVPGLAEMLGAAATGGTAPEPDLRGPPDKATVKQIKDLLAKIKDAAIPMAKRVTLLHDLCGVRLR